jgi:hypothetical protein
MGGHKRFQPAVRKHLPVTLGNALAEQLRPVAPAAYRDYAWLLDPFGVSALPVVVAGVSGTSVSYRSSSVTDLAAQAPK